MALTASGLYIQTFTKMVTNGFTTPVNLSGTTGAAYKIALINNGATPNFATDTAYTASTGTYGLNEVTGTGWNSGNAGGVTLSAAAAGSTSVVPTVTTTADNGGIKYDHTNDISVSSTTLSNVYGCFFHTNVNNGATTNPLIALIWFGGSPYSTSNGTFGISWATGGVFAIDLTP
jgi:hypothetical protein